MNAPNVQRLGSAVIVQGPAVAALAFLAARGARECARTDGQTLGGMTGQLLEALTRAADEWRRTTPPGRGEYPPAPVTQPLSMADQIGTAEAARILGVSPRRARQLRADLDGRLVGGALVFDRAAVDIYAATRDRTAP